MEKADLKTTTKLGKRLRCIREILGYSQQEMAELYNINQAELQEIEQDKIPDNFVVLKLDFLRDVAGAGKVPLSWLIDGRVNGQDADRVIVENLKYHIALEMISIVCPDAMPIIDKAREEVVVLTA